MVILVIIWLTWWALSWIPPQWAKINKLPATAMTIAPFIFYTAEYIPGWLKNHELRHILQQRILSPPIFILLYVANYLINLSWAWIGVITKMCNTDWKLYPWRNSKLLSQIHAIAYVYILFELDAICHGGWITKPERRR